MRYFSFSIALSLALYALQPLVIHGAAAPQPFSPTQAQTPQCTTANEFLSAAIRGDLAVVKAYLDENGDPNVTGAYGMTALMYAACYGREVIIEELLKCPKLFTKQTDHNAFNAADYAFQTHRNGILQVLRNHGCYEQWVVRRILFSAID